MKIGLWRPPLLTLEICVPQRKQTMKTTLDSKRRGISLLIWPAASVSWLVTCPWRIRARITVNSRAVRCLTTPAVSPALSSCVHSAIFRQGKKISACDFCGNKCFAGLGGLHTWYTSLRIPERKLIFLENFRRQTRLANNRKTLTLS